MLRNPTAAVDAQRVVRILPIGAILTVTSDTSFEKRMIEVMWKDCRLAMFGSDLTERGEENFIAAAFTQSDFGDPQEIRQMLEEDFDAANKRRAEASRRFTKAIDDEASEFPHPDGGDSVRLASLEYANAREAANEAVTRLSEFIIRGIIPEGLERKPISKETRSQSKKAGQG